MIRAPQWEPESLKNYYSAAYKMKVYMGLTDELTIEGIKAAENYFNRGVFSFL